jgi:hypothetical protein
MIDIVITRSIVYCTSLLRLITWKAAIISLLARNASNSIFATRGIDIHIQLPEILITKTSFFNSALQLCAAE